ncbi:MAG: DUF3592 domain-containing protein [Reyranella sp.]|uniref:DUF3592 domain-containing protein n=1 Tax=Reyranella sp. TaxID=1929291 RepID=UPI00272FA6C5|nr:DUF3592 domain-containing protein [Reyranella sp.]MDP1966959.1 DUF3592 domain-containing protein [Reyranella sp.]MDP2373501.1 DUF3592 domain-containing protein [Reyranella sp.]
MAADRDWRWISRIILGIGGLILAGGLALGLGSLRHVLHGERADGEVIEIRRDGDMYAPVVRFGLPGDVTQEVTDLATGAPDFAVGDRVSILYMPQDPRDFRIDTFERLWFSAIFVTVFGGFWMLFGIVAWALSRGIDLAVVGEQAFAVIAVAAGLIGIFVLWSAADLYTGGVRAEGVVLENRESRRTESETVRLGDGREVDRTVERVSFAPVVRFTTREGGREIEFHGRGGSDRSFAQGERVTVIYDPANPIRARIVSFVDIWLPSAVAFAVAFVFGGAVWLSRRMRRRTTDPRA